MCDECKFEFNNEKYAKNEFENCVPCSENTFKSYWIVFKFCFKIFIAFMTFLMAYKGL